MSEDMEVWRRLPDAFHPADHCLSPSRSACVVRHSNMKRGITIPGHMVQENEARCVIRTRSLYLPSLPSTCSWPSSFCTQRGFRTSVVRRSDVANTSHFHAHAFCLSRGDSDGTDDICTSILRGIHLNGICDVWGTTSLHFTPGQTPLHTALPHSSDAVVDQAHMKESQGLQPTSRHGHSCRACMPVHVCQARWRWCPET